MHQIIVDCTREEADALSELLESVGSLCVTFTDREDDPILEPAPGTTPLWKQVVITALFADQPRAESAQLHLKSQLAHLTPRLEKVEEKEWTREWMDQLHPMKFGEKLWICPSWQTPPDEHGVNLILDPGLAFGTGTHHTTSLCLTWLDKACLNNKVILDFGCGSGILALAALKLGAKQAYAVDIDPQALTATRNNAAENGIDEHQLTVSFPEKLEVKTDILIANILLKPLLELKLRFVSLLNPGGQLVVSGILKEQVSDLIANYESHFIQQTTETREDWSLVAFQRR